MLLRPYSRVACANTLHMLNKFPLFVVVRGERMRQPASERACMCWSVIFYAMSISTNFFIIIIVLPARVVAVVIVVAICLAVSSNQAFQLHTKSNLCTLTEMLGWVNESVCRKSETKRDAERKQTHPRHAERNRERKRDSKRTNEWDRACRYEINTMARAETSVPRGNLIPIYDRFTWLLHDSYFMCARFRYSFLRSKRATTEEEYTKLWKCVRRMKVQTNGMEYNTKVLKWKIAFYDGICALVCANQFRFWWHNVHSYPMKLHFAYSFESCQWKYVCA